MRIEQPITVIARNMVITVVREIEAVVSLAIAFGYLALGNCLLGNDSLHAMQMSDLHKSWGSHAPARTAASRSLSILRHQHKPMLASCLASSQLSENRRYRADG
jgi:hypothetical protein